MVKIQANTLDSWLTANIPNTHVTPSKGNSITVAFKIVLKTYIFSFKYSTEIILCILLTTDERNVYIHTYVACAQNTFQVEVLLTMHDIKESNSICDNLSEHT